MFWKGRNQRTNCQQLLDHRENNEFHKNIYFCFTDYAKAFDCVDHTNCGKFLKRWAYQTILPASWEICMLVKKEKFELDKEHLTGSKLGKEYDKALHEPRSPRCSN